MSVIPREPTMEKVLEVPMNISTVIVEMFIGVVRKTYRASQV